MNENSAVGMWKGSRERKEDVIAQSTYVMNQSIKIGVTVNSNSFQFQRNFWNVECMELEWLECVVIRNESNSRGCEV